MNKIEKYIPIALKVLADKDLGIVKNNEISSTYNGYISSFGASIISSGLLPTFIFYSKSAESTKDADRSLIPKAIEKMLKEIKFLDNNENLNEKIIHNFNDARLRQKIQECAIALKLAIRTYPQTKTDNDELEKS